MQEGKKQGSIASVFSIAQYSSIRWRLCLCLSALGIVCEAIPFVSVYFIVEHVLSMSAASEAMNADVFAFWGFLALASLVVGVVFTLGGGYGAYREAYRVLHRLRSRVMAHVSTLSLGYLSSTGTGELQKLMGSGMAKIENLMAHVLPNLIGAMPLLIAFLGSMLILDLWLTLAVVLAMVVAFGIQALAFSGSKNRQVALEMSKRAGRLNQRFNEYLQGISVVKIFGQAEASSHEVIDSIIAYRDFYLGFSKRVSVPFSLFKTVILSVGAFVMPVGVALIMLYGANLESVLTFLMFLIVTPCLYSPIMELMQIGPSILEAANSVAEIKRVLAVEPLPVSKAPQIPQRHDVSFKRSRFPIEAPMIP